MFLLLGTIDAFNFYKLSTLYKLTPSFIWFSNDTVPERTFLKILKSFLNKRTLGFEFGPVVQVVWFWRPLCWLGGFCVLVAAESGVRIWCQWGAFGLTLLSVLKQWFCCNRFIV